MHVVHGDALPDQTKPNCRVAMPYRLASCLTQQDDLLGPAAQESQTAEVARLRLQEFLEQRKNQLRRLTLKLAQATTVEEADRIRCKNWKTSIFREYSNCSKIKI